MKSNPDSQDFRNADLGYEEYMGPREDFQEGYRGGYKAGYDDGFNDRPVHTDIYGLTGESYDPIAFPGEMRTRMPTRSGRTPTSRPISVIEMD